MREVQASRCRWTFNDLRSSDAGLWLASRTTGAALYDPAERSKTEESLGGSNPGFAVLSRAGTL